MSSLAALRTPQHRTPKPVFQPTNKKNIISQNNLKRTQMHLLISSCHHLSGCLWRQLLSKLAANTFYSTMIALIRGLSLSYIGLKCRCLSHQCSAVRGKEVNHSLVFMFEAKCLPKADMSKPKPSTSSRAGNRSTRWHRVLITLLVVRSVSFQPNVDFTRFPRDWQPASKTLHSVAFLPAGPSLCLCVRLCNHVFVSASVREWNRIV